jgi:hypothetical protein
MLIVRKFYNISNIWSLEEAIVNYTGKKKEFHEVSFYNICKFFNFILEAYDFWIFLNLN